MPILKEQLHEIFDAITKRATKNRVLRVGFDYDSNLLIDFNRNETCVIKTRMGKVINSFQELKTNPESGLPFNKIQFRIDDSGAGLGYIQFKSGQFVCVFHYTHQFESQGIMLTSYADLDYNSDRNADMKEEVVNFCAVLNHVVSKSSLNPTQNEYNNDIDVGNLDKPNIPDLKKTKVQLPFFKPAKAPTSVLENKHDAQFDEIPENQSDKDNSI